MRVSRVIGVASGFAVGAYIACTELRLLTNIAAQQTEAFAAKLLLDDETGFPTDVSPDGSKVLVVRTDVSPSRLVIRDVRTSATHGLNVGGTDWERARPAAVFSPDAARVAYAWTEPAPGTPGGIRTNLRLIGTGKDAVPQTLAGAGHVPHGWALDGKSLLILIHGAFRDPQSIGWLSLADGSIRTIHTSPPWRGGPNAADPRLSPDGTQIAYSAFAGDDSPTRFLYVMDANGQNSRPVVTLEGNNTQPLWTPDGSHLVFINTRGNERHLCAVPIAVGRTQPVKLQPDFRGELLRFSKSGDLSYWQPGNVDVQFISELRNGKPRVIQSFFGRKGTWSRDGRLAFFQPGFSSGLVIRSIATSAEQRHNNIANGNAPPRWLSDGSALIVHVPPNRDGGRIGGSFYRVDARTGEFSRLFGRNTDEHSRSFVGVLSPDDTTLYLASRARAAGSPWNRIVAVDLKTATERVVAVLQGSGFSTPPDLSVNPDGARLAIRAENGRLFTMHVNSTEYRELAGPMPGFANPFGSASEGSPGMLHWTTDGKSLLMAVGDPVDWRLSTVRADDGKVQIESVEPLLPKGFTSGSQRRSRLTSFEPNGDGSRVAFSTQGDPVYAIFAMPNFVEAVRRVGK